MEHETDAILSNHQALLSSLGTRYNDLYYSAANASVSLVETTFGYQNRISLGSFTFGSSSQVNLPIDQFVDLCILHLRLPATTANQTLCRGWGYGMLQSIGYTFGASNSTAITLQGDSILQAVLAQCMTEEKRSEILRLAGEEQKGIPAAPVGEDAPYMDAYVLLPLPFSTACDKLPMDSTLLSNNIVLTVNFAQAAAVYGGSDARPTQFLMAEIMLRQGKLSNQAASLRQEMIARPDLIYSYPFIHYQNFVTPSFTGVKESTSLRGVQQVLNSFTNGDLVGIVLWVIKDTDKAPTANSSPNPFHADEISNVLVTLNGVNLFDLPYKSYKLTDTIIGEQGPGFFHGSVIAAGATYPFTSACVDSYLCFLDFSRLRSACMQEHLFNVAKLTNQNINIQFNTATESSYKLHATYMYNAAIEFQGGTSAIKIA